MAATGDSNSDAVVGAGRLGEHDESSASSRHDTNSEKTNHKASTHNKSCTVCGGPVTISSWNKGNSMLWCNCRVEVRRAWAVLSLLSVLCPAPVSCGRKDATDEATGTTKTKRVRTRCMSRTHMVACQPCLQACGRMHNLCSCQENGEASSDPQENHAPLTGDVSSVTKALDKFSFDGQPVETGTIRRVGTYLQKGMYGDALLSLLMAAPGVMKDWAVTVTAALVSYEVGAACSDERNPYRPPSSPKRDAQRRNAAKRKTSYKSYSAIPTAAEVDGCPLVGRAIMDFDEPTAFQYLRNAVGVLVRVVEAACGGRRGLQARKNGAIQVMNIVYKALYARSKDLSLGVQVTTAVLQKRGIPTGALDVLSCHGISVAATAGRRVLDDLSAAMLERLIQLSREFQVGFVFDNINWFQPNAEQRFDKKTGKYVPSYREGMSVMALVRTGTSSTLEKQGKALPPANTPDRTTGSAATLRPAPDVSAASQDLTSDAQPAAEGIDAAEVLLLNRHSRARTRRLLLKAFHKMIGRATSESLPSVDIDVGSCCGSGICSHTVEEFLLPISEERNNSIKGVTLLLDKLAFGLRRMQDPEATNAYEVLLRELSEQVGVDLSEDDEGADDGPKEKVASLLRRMRQSLTTDQRCFLGGDQLSVSRAISSQTIRHGSKNDIESLDMFIPVPSGFHFLMALVDAIFKLFCQSNEGQHWQGSFRSFVSALNRKVNMKDYESKSTAVEEYACAIGITLLAKKLGCTVDSLLAEPTEREPKRRKARRAKASKKAKSSKQRSSSAAARPKERNRIDPRTTKDITAEQLEESVGAIFDEWIWRDRDTVEEDYFNMRTLQTEAHAMEAELNDLSSLLEHLEEAEDTYAQELLDRAETLQARADEIEKRLQGALNKWFPVNEQRGTTCSFMYLALLKAAFEDAVSEGRDEDVYLLWNAALPAFVVANKHNYAIESIRIALIYGHELLTDDERQRVIESHLIKSRSNGHVPVDLRLEHVNKTIKDLLKGLNATSTEESVDRRCISIPALIELDKKYSSWQNVARSSSRHSTRRIPPAAIKNGCNLIKASPMLQSIDTPSTTSDAQSAVDTHKRAVTTKGKLRAIKDHARLMKGLQNDIRKKKYSTNTAE